MLKELLLCGSALSSLGTPTIQRSHVVEENDVAITYKYETNDVEDFDDLVVGNIYHFSIINESLDAFTYIGSTNQFWFNFINFDSFDFSSYSFDYSETISNIGENGYLSVLFDITATQTMINVYPLYSSSNDYLFSFGIESLEFAPFILEGDFIFEYGDFTGMSMLTSFISRSDFNIIESVERVYPENIFGFVSSFIDEHLLNGIPNIDNVVNTIGGQTITMRSWLNTSICVVLAILLIALLVWFIRYLFKLFSGLLH